jgi:hypothetical protein
MSRTLFENSKAALAFAGLTLFGAVSMVGTSDNNGVLPQVVDRFAKPPQKAPASSEERAAEEAGAQPEPKPDDGWYDAPPSVFGDYTPTDAATASPQPGEPQAGTPAAPRQSAGNPMTAPLSPNAIVVN